MSSGITNFRKRQRDDQLMLVENQENLKILGRGLEIPSENKDMHFDIVRCVDNRLHLHTECGKHENIKELVNLAKTKLTNKEHTKVIIGTVLTGSIVSFTEHEEGITLYLRECFKEQVLFLKDKLKMKIVLAPTAMGWVKIDALHIL